MAKTPKKRSGKTVLGGRGTLYAPTEAKPRWQCAIHDPVTLKRRIFSAVSQDAVLDKARRALGDWDPVEETRTSRPPTLQEAFDAWLQDESGRWSDRTPQAYRTRFNTHLKDLAEVPVTAIKPADLRDVALGTSREQARRVRTIVRAIFDSTERWHGRKGQLYGDAVALPESRSSDTPRTVESTQIPNSDWINGVVDCALLAVPWGPPGGAHPGVSRLVAMVTRSTDIPGRKPGPRGPAPVTRPPIQVSSIVSHDGLCLHLEVGP